MDQAKPSSIPSAITRSSSPATPSILDLPNEVLNEIFSYVVSDHHARVEFSDNNGWRSVAQILVLSSVCCRFRTVVFELPFWYQDEFEFRNLLDPKGDDFIYQSLREANFIYEFLDNAYIVSRFARKKEWKFFNLDALLAVNDDIPTFKSNTTKIVLSTFEHSPDNWFWDTVPILEKCVNLRALTFASCQQEIFLTSLNTICPQLEELEILESSVIFDMEYEGYPPSLRRLHVSKACDEWDYFPLLWLPSRAVENLTDLSVVYYADSLYEDENEDDENMTDLSNNLKHQNLTTFEISPLTAAVCRAIAKGNSRLNEFTFSSRADTFFIPRDNFRQMFSSISLQSLTILSIHFEYDDRWLDIIEYGQDIFYYITQHLLLLETFELTFPLSLKWFSHLTNLTKLKHIEWNVSWEDIEHSAVFPCMFLNWFDSIPIKCAIESHFQSTFKDYNPIPRFELTIEGECPESWDLIDCSCDSHPMP